MSVRTGKCTNFGNCSRADRGQVLKVRNAWVCPECKGSLRPLRPQERKEGPSSGLRSSPGRSFPNLRDITIFQWTVAVGGLILVFGFIGLMVALVDSEEPNRSSPLATNEPVTQNPPVAPTPRQSDSPESVPPEPVEPVDDNDDTASTRPDSDEETSASPVGPEPSTTPRPPPRRRTGQPSGSGRNEPETVPPVVVESPSQLSMGELRQRVDEYTNVLIDPQISDREAERAMQKALALFASRQVVVRIITVRGTVTERIAIDDFLRRQRLLKRDRAEIQEVTRNAQGQISGIAIIETTAN